LLKGGIDEAPRDFGRIAAVYPSFYQLFKQPLGLNGNCDANGRAIYSVVGLWHNLAISMAKLCRNRKKKASELLRR
jgi:hypothetical protein